MSKQLDADPVQTQKQPQKQALRQDFKQRRANLNPSQRLSAHQNIQRHLTDLLTQRDEPLEHVAVYLAGPTEVDLQAWIDLALLDGIALCAPVIAPNQGQMAFYPLTSTTTLRANRFHLKEPTIECGAKAVDSSLLDVALVPLLAFDDHGSRLGMGGGYYDRYFATDAGHHTGNNHKRPLIIGIAYDVQRATDPLITEPWDIRLNAVVTESGSRFFADQ